MVEAAQTGLVDLSRRIYAGPDTDSLPAEYRYDVCHLNGKGAHLQAKMWVTALTAPRLKGVRRESMN